MGRSDAYYLLWRLLLPDQLAAQKAFERMDDGEKGKHLLRRMKEEMITFDEKPIYPPRESRTIAYPLKQGEISEQSLYDEVTDYCEKHFDLAGQYNRTAAKMAMMVLQRRIASSTYSLLQSLMRREEKLQTTLRELREGRLSSEMLDEGQAELPSVDVREDKTGDEEEIIDGQEESEQMDEELSGATSARSVEDLEEEILRVQALVKLARSVYDLKSESKFERLWEALEDFPDTKVLIFTEHKDTMDFVIWRLEALGFTGKIAQIHGGMKYEERERQVEHFRDPNGAQYLVATDAAGEGINLQFCWLMVNYDIPWNPARLEQRMGRIHRYKQRNTVVLLNLVAEDTREGRVLKVLLDKLEQMRRELSDDKVFDVVGQQFSDVPLAKLIEQAITGNQTDAAIRTIDSQFTPENIRKHLEDQRNSVASSEIRRLLAGVQKQKESAETLRVMPSYVRGFFKEAAPFVGYEIDGDVERIFKLSSCPPSIGHAIQRYPPHLHQQLTFSKELALPAEVDQPQAIYVHPGEPVFEAISALFLGEFEGEGNCGAVYRDPQTEKPYLFYLARVPVVRHRDDERHVLDEALAGVKQFADGRCESAPAHLLLTLKRQGEPHFPIDREWVKLADNLKTVESYVSEKLGKPKLSDICEELQSQLGNRKRQIQISLNLRRSELLEQRVKLREAVARAVPAARSKLNVCEQELDELPAKRATLEASLDKEIENTRLGAVSVYLRALVVPPEEEPVQSTHDAEMVAIETAIQYEREHGAEIEDVSDPQLMRGFDLESRHPDGEVRYIEVKGRTGMTSVELTRNEWTQAGNHQDRYWLYTVYHCESENPTLYRCQNPHGKGIGRPKEGVIVNASEIISNAE